MKAFLTGASGFVGGHLLRALEASGRDVVCLIRPTSDRRNFDDSTSSLVVGDLTQPETYREALEGCSELYHCAADYRLFVRRPAEMYAANVEGTEKVLAAASDSDVQRIVYTSSVGALGLRQDGRAADERTPVGVEDMIGHYKRSKFLAERAAEQAAAAGAPVVIVNPSTPIGDGDWKPTATGQVIVDFLRRRTPAYVETGLNWIDVRDVAIGHILAAEKGRVGEKYILGNENLSLEAFFDILQDITGLSAPSVKLPHALPIAFAAFDTLRARLLGGTPRVAFDAARLARYKMYFDSAKAVGELGLPQSSVREALARAVAWYRAEGYVGSA